MGRDRVVEKYKFKKLYWNAGRYYDHPDGKDLVGKLMFTNKIAGFTGILFSIVWVHGSPSPPATVHGKLLGYLRCTLPFLGAATTFTCVTYFSTNIRKKDDPFNYALGGLAAGLFLIPATKTANFGVMAALLFAGLGYCQKALQMKGLPFFSPIVFKQRSTYYERMLNTSLEPETGGNWTK